MYYSQIRSSAKTIFTCYQQWCYRYLFNPGITYRAMQRKKSERERRGFNIFHQKYFWIFLCFSKIDFTWCEWKNGKLNHPKSTIRAGCKYVMYFITGVVRLQSFQPYNRTIVLPAVAGRVWAVVLAAAIASTTHKQRGNKLIKDILDMYNLQD